MITIDDIAEKRLAWAKHLQKENEKLEAEVKRLREVIDKEHPTFDWASRQTIANLDAEVKQIHEILREAFTTEAKHSGAEYLNMIARVTGLIG